MISHEERDRLLRALVGDRHRAKYAGSARFHMHIQALADMIPLMIDGLAADDDAKAAEMDAEIRRLMSEPMLPLFFRDLDEL